MADNQVGINNLIYKYGDILDVSDQYIGQQCNCTSSNYKGLSKSIVERFPWATFYSTPDRQPGTIVVKGSEEKAQRYVIGMFAQRYISIPKYSNDTANMRLQWFEECLNQISKIPNITTLGLPYNIGCGLAGGDWNLYLSTIKKFALSNPHITVTVYEYKCSK